MAIAPASTLVACFPLQEQFWDKDLNVPLAAGTVSFFSDPGYTIAKNVYVFSTTRPYAIAGTNGVLTLSSIGTFTNLGSNFIPFLYPFVGSPDQDPYSTTSQPYYIKVVSAQGVEQFTVDNWPPNVQEPSSGGGSSGITQVVKQTFTTPGGTYTPTSGMSYCIIECMGAGGGGGGSAPPGLANTLVTAGGGGAGGYSRTVATFAAITPSKAVTVGAGGAGGVAGSNPGGNGASTAVGSLCIAQGGTGGGTVSQQIGGAGGIAGTGDLTATGAPGFTGYGGANTSNVGSGQGASTQWGGGGLGINGAGTGNAATGYGAGGSGGTSANGGSNAAGGAGAPGFVFITEYLST